jgi:hypothetical protein
MAKKDTASKRLAEEIAEVRARAFLAVPLFRAMFEKYRGGVLPPSAALERDVVALGVSEKQKGRARQVFERSAELAGYFEHGKNRLVMPASAPREQSREDENSREETDGGGGGGGPNDPLIRAVIQKLPAKGPWPTKARITWMKMLAMAFDIAYGPADEEVDITRELNQ